MTSQAFGFLDLASIATVGETLLSAVPAFVFSADGTGVLFANAAGAAFFGTSAIPDLLDREISGLNPLKAQMARFARQLPSETARLEMLRVGMGLSIATLPAACRRINLADGGRVVLAVATAGEGPRSLTARAEALVDALAGGERIVAVLAADGKPLAASGRLDEFAPAEGFIDALVADAQGADEWPVRRVLEGQGARLTAGIIRFAADGKTLYLMMAETDRTWARPASRVAQAKPVAKAEPAQTPPAEARASEPVTEPASAPEAAAKQEPVTEPAPEPPPAPEVAAAVDSALPAEPISPAEAAPPTLEMETLPPAASPPPPPDERLSSPVEDDLDLAAQEVIERGTRIGNGTPPAPPVPPAPPSNVVRLQTQAGPRAVQESLSGSERDAFRRIAEALGKKGEAKDESAAPQPPVSPPPPSAAPPAPAAPARSTETADFDGRLLDRVPVAIVIFRDRKTLFANRTLLDLLGYDSLDAFAAAGGSEAIFPGGGLARNVAAAGDKLTARRRDGGVVAVKAWLHAVTFHGATALMLSLIESDGREDETALASARWQARTEELEAILDTATDGVIVTDQRGKIRSVNRSAQALFGIGATDFVGRYFTDLFAEESQKPALDYLDGLAANGVASVLNDGREVIGRVPAGGLIPLFMTMGRIDGSDKFCMVLRDITHWKNVEAELTAARQAAEAASLQKSEFLAKISHEIRTPLNAIIGFSEVMMGERFGPIGNPRYRDYLRDINVSGGHLMSLINDLLDLSKVEAGKLDLNFEEVRVNAAIQECVALMQPQANRQRIIIRTSLAADLPNVVADQRSFRQILLNLMSNAVKFTRAGGQVIVSTALEERGEVAVRIRDTGIGMSEKDIEAALKPFRQVAISPQDRAQGTGLGLPLTKALVEANRASFSIDSALDQGTLVKVTFPTTRVLAG